MQRARDAVEFYGEEPKYTYVHGDSGGRHAWFRAARTVSEELRRRDRVRGRRFHNGRLIPRYSRYEEFTYKLASKVACDGRYGASRMAPVIHSRVH